MVQEEQQNTASNNGAFMEGFNPGPQQGEEGWTEVKNNKRKNNKSKMKNEKEKKTSGEKRKSEKVDENNMEEGNETNKEIGRNNEMEE
eukprot:8012169-Ditylum_brightwellii.AAC.1